MAGRLTYPAFVLAALLPLAGVPAAVHAQPVDIPLPAATTTEFPAGIKVAKVPGGQVYVDARGRTLYGMDMRMVTRWAVDTSKYCENRCAEWEPVLAPADAKPNLTLFRGFRNPSGGGAGGSGGAGAGTARPAGAPTTGGAGAAGGGAQAGAVPAGVNQQQLAASFGMGGAPPGMFTQANAPDWTIVDGPAGPQYVYKGYSMVYVRKGDRPRSTQYDGAEDRIWNTLKFIPPVPKLTAPGGVGAVFVKDAYLLTDKDGKLLYTGRCGKDCAGWKPLAAGVASQGMGDWAVDRTTDRPMWLYRGKPVFVAADDQVASLPRATVALRP